MDNLSVKFKTSEKEKIDKLTEIAQERLGESEVMVEDGKEDLAEISIKEYELNMDKAIDVIESNIESIEKNTDSKEINDKKSEIDKLKKSVINKQEKSKDTHKNTVKEKYIEANEKESDNNNQSEKMKVIIQVI